MTCRLEYRINIQGVADSIKFAQKEITRNKKAQSNKQWSYDLNDDNTVFIIAFKFQLFLKYLLLLLVNSSNIIGACILTNLIALLSSVNINNQKDAGKYFEKIFEIIASGKYWAIILNLIVSES